MSCSDCFSGHVHSGEPKGRVTKLYGFDAYIVEPEPGNPVRGTIVLLPDVLGWEFVNIRIVADHYCEKGGFRCILPDLMDGKPAPTWIIKTFRALSTCPWWSKPYHFFWAAVGVIPFLMRSRPSQALPRAITFFTALRKDMLSEPQPLPLGCAGYCWGGKMIALIADPAKAPPVPESGRRALLDVGFVGHPSQIVIPDEIDAMQIPTAWAIGYEDRMFPEKVLNNLKEAVAKKEEGLEGEVKVYPGCGHGFCVRLEEQDTAMKAASEAEDQAVGWFLKWFKML